MNTDVRTFNHLALLSQGSWAERRCFIVGCGPSVYSFPLVALGGERTISVNAALLLFTPTVAFSMDSKYVRDCQAGKFGPDLMWKWQSHPCRLFQNAIEEESQGCNSGLSAIKLAVFLGSPEIFLLGFDFGRAKDGRANCHDLPEYPKPEQRVYDDMIAITNEWAAEYDGPSRIVNLNPDSNLRCFEFGDVDEVLPKVEAA